MHECLNEYVCMIYIYVCECVLVHYIAMQHGRATPDISAWAYGSPSFVGPQNGDLTSTPAAFKVVNELSGFKGSMDGTSASSPIAAGWE